ncbi:hypothetical protein [Pelagibius sp. Alg239-R121]|uniref:hypothetical protein n=1 Tax=Pelagibius sp. Alg239-R121 TaxID=2993448 RepID=UPI0024A61DF1|nr:hypothetical protein [Pelagibius sp. Alg239-R121]
MAFSVLRLALLFVFVVVTGCSSNSRHTYLWSDAQKEDGLLKKFDYASHERTRIAYVRYLLLFKSDCDLVEEVTSNPSRYILTPGAQSCSLPNEKHRLRVETAVQRVQEIDHYMSEFDWDNRTLDYETFAVRYPNSRRVPEARWRQILEKPTIQKLGEYQNLYIDGEFTDDAAEMEASLRKRATSVSQPSVRISGRTVTLEGERLAGFKHRVVGEIDGFKLEKPIEYYIVTGDRTLTKSKAKAGQKGQKACALDIEASGLELHLTYIDGADRALFAYKIRHDMCHNGYAGPGLEVSTELGPYLKLYSIRHRNINSTTRDLIGYVIPDAIRDSDVACSSYPHRGRDIRQNDSVFEVEGIRSVKPATRVSSYSACIKLKAFLQTVEPETLDVE